MRTKLYFIGLLIILSGCSLRSKDKLQENPPIPVKVCEISTTSQTVLHSYVGTIESKSNTSLSMPTAGMVKKVNVTVGDKVSANQVLVVLDNTQAINALQSAQAMLHQAEDGYKRVKEVYDVGGITEQKLVEVESQLAQARSLVSAAEKNVQDCILRAPKAGRIGKCDVQIGQMAMPSVPIISLIDATEFFVDFSVPESEIGDIEVESNGILSIPAIKMDQISISIEEKNLLADPISHTYKVRAKINDNVSVMQGMVGKVQLMDSESSDIFIPSECVMLTKSGTSVWQVLPDSTVCRKTVIVGDYVSKGVSIMGGLNAGDIIVVDGFQKLYNNAKVTY